GILASCLWRGRRRSFGTGLEHGLAVARIISLTTLCEDLSLLDPLLPVDPSRNFKFLPDPLDVRRAPSGDVLEIGDAARFKLLLDLRVDRSDALKIVSALDRYRGHDRSLDRRFGFWAWHRFGLEFRLWFRLELRFVFN